MDTLMYCVDTGAREWLYDLCRQWKNWSVCRLDGEVVYTDEYGHNWKEV